jgi:hypothetical protein
VLATLCQRRNFMPAILITAHPDAKTLERASAAGVTLIKRSFQQAVLLGTVSFIHSASVTKIWIVPAADGHTELCSNVWASASLPTSRGSDPFLAMADS